MKNRKTQILELSNQLVQKFGYDSFSYADIAKELDITKASVHHHFPKKDDLGAALCHLLQKKTENSFSAILNSKIAAPQKMQAYFDLYSEFTNDGDKICPISSLQVGVNILSNMMRDKIKDIDNLEIKFVQKLLDEGKNNKIFSFRSDSYTEAILITSALKGSLQYSRIHGSKYYKEVTDVLIQKYLLD